MSEDPQLDNRVMETCCTTIRKLKKHLAEFKSEYKTELEQSGELENVLKEICYSKGADKPQEESKTETVAAEEGKDSAKEPSQTNPKWCTHECYNNPEKLNLYLTPQLIEETSEIIERHFSRKLVKIRSVEKAGEKAIQAIERLMKMVNVLSIPLSKKAAVEIKGIFGDKLQSEDFHFTSKVLEKEPVDIKITNKKPERKQKEPREPREPKEEKKQKKKSQWTEDDCDALGMINLLREFRKAASNKQTDMFLECLLAFLEAFPFASYLQQKDGIKIIESCYKEASK